MYLICPHAKFQGPTRPPDDVIGHVTLTDYSKIGFLMKKKLFRHYERITDQYECVPKLSTCKDSRSYDDVIRSDDVIALLKK